jgi:hypothetical protein
MLTGLTGGGLITDNGNAWSLRVDGRPAAKPTPSFMALIRKDCLPFS